MILIGIGTEVEKLWLAGAGLEIWVTVTPIEFRKLRVDRTLTASGALDLRYVLRGRVRHSSPAREVRITIWKARDS